MPPPAVFFISAVMDGGDFPQLQCIDDQADIAVPREPHAMPLGGRLVAVAPAPGVSADGKYSRQSRSLSGTGRPIQVAGDVQPGPALVMQHVDDEPVTGESSCGCRLQGRALGKRGEPEHVEVFIAIEWATGLPARRCFD